MVKLNELSQDGICHWEWHWRARCVLQWNPIICLMKHTYFRVNVQNQVTKLKVNICSECILNIHTQGKNYLT